MSDAVPTRAGTNGHVYQWITDRQPTEIDANSAGAVRIRKYPNGSSSAAVHWSFIGIGVPWQHCNDWNETSATDHYVDEKGNSWQWVNDDWHLVAKVPISSEFVTSSHIPRQFVSILRAFGPHGQHYLDVVASDGTAWYQDLALPTRSWYQHISLPEVTE